MKRREVVIARHRREVLIEDRDGTVRSCLIQGRKIKPLAGDEITWEERADGTTVIVEILPRRTLLERIDGRGRAEGIAANVSLLLPVIAPRPIPDWPLVDRYLVAAKLIGIEAALVANKQDLADPAFTRHAAVYADLGYEVISTSAGTQHGPGNQRGLGWLRAALTGHRGVLVEQSGAGKSSLLNALLDSDCQATGGLSRRRPLGKHTTTAAMLFRLPGSGELIDSPGVRRYAPKIDDIAELEHGFREFQNHLGRCRFADCRHFDEPDCAILDALQRGEIRKERYDSYRSLRTTLDERRCR